MSWDISNPKTRQREIAGLLHFQKELGGEKMILLTYDHEEQTREISALPVWKWLLQE